MESLYHAQWQKKAPGVLPRREKGRTRIRRSCRTSRQTRELSPKQWDGAGGEEGIE